MSPEFWAIIGVGGALLVTILKTNEHLAEINGRLQTLWQEIIERRR
jgi:hypothetical protein